MVIFFLSPFFLFRAAKLSIKPVSLNFFKIYDSDLRGFSGDFEILNSVHMERGWIFILPDHRFFLNTRTNIKLFSSRYHLNECL